MIGIFSNTSNGIFIYMWKKNIHLELVSKVYKETGLFGMITVADCSTQRSEYGVVKICGLYAKEDAVVKKLFHFLCL